MSLILTRTTKGYVRPYQTSMMEAFWENLHPTGRRCSTKISVVTDSTDNTCVNFANILRHLFCRTLLDK